MRRPRLRRPRVRRRRERGDAGHVTVLALGLVVIAFALVAAVANVSRVFLVDRSLAAAADGAATAAARGVEPRPVRASPAGVPSAALSPARARIEVDRYVADAGLPDRFGPGFGYTVEVREGVVTVTLRARVRLAFLPTAVAAHADGVGLTGTAAARAALSD